MQRYIALTIALLACLATSIPFTNYTSHVLAAGEGAACDGPAGVACDSGLWCEHPQNTCGAKDVAGKCVKVPAAGCPTELVQSCGCDGKTYPGDCKRQKAGVQEMKDGPC